jgi:hypothetical protein
MRQNVQAPTKTHRKKVHIKSLVDIIIQRFIEARKTRQNRAGWNPGFRSLRRYSFIQLAEHRFLDAPENDDRSVSNLLRRSKR